jgi:hypothetical protein
MTTLNINFDETPDEIQPIEPGIYDLHIQSCEIQPTKDGNSQKIVVEAAVVNHSDDNVNGRKVFDHISVKMATKIKRLAKSSGFTDEELSQMGGSFDVSLLIDRIVRASIGQRSYQDPESGEQRTTSNVRDYIFETS